MKPTTCRLPDEYLQALDELVKIGHYVDRNEAIRAAVRDLLKEENFLYDLKLYEQIPKLRELIENWRI